MEKVYFRVFFGDNRNVIEPKDSGYELFEQEIIKIIKGAYPKANASECHWVNKAYVDAWGLRQVKTRVYGNYYIELYEKPKKEEKMKQTIFGNFSFGKISTDQFKLSMNGVAVKTNEGKYVVYNAEGNEFVDVTDSLFDIKDGLFMLPAVDVAPGDVVVHAKKPYYIVDVNDGIKAVSFEDSTQTTLIPRTTMFGLKFFTKVFSLLGDISSGSDFLNNPMMLMLLTQGEKDSGNLTKMMLMSSLSNKETASNPMLLAMLMGGEGSDMSSLAMMAMMNGTNNPFATKKETIKKREE
jgi:hypothetical protein